MSLSDRHALAAEFVFDGDVLHENHAVVIDGATIAAVVPRRDLPAAMPVRNLPAGAWLAPGFIDVQVNGGGDVLFNDAPSPESIATIAAAHRRFGTTALLPTLISDAPHKMAAALTAVQRMVGLHPGVLGIHLEGPFLSPERPGVHDPAAIRRPLMADVETLTALRGGVTLVTLAPEEAPSGFVAALTRAGVRVSLGHSMATYEETQHALAEGLTGFTHLFNAMRPLASRDPGPIAAALETPGCWYGLIVDGAHVHPSVLRLALRGAGQAMLVTDAMPPVGGTQPHFTLYGEEITVRDGRCLRSDGTLAGAALDMASAVRNSVTQLHLPLTSALRFAATTPAAFLGLSGALGRLAPGYRADVVAIDHHINVLATWVAGGADDDLPR
jgi:N-acetylglucosamine-6-phosphate deacetylase